MFELIIVGAGPIGLFAGFYAGMRQLKTTILESSANYGGQPQSLYPQKIIYDIPGIKSISAGELVESLYEQYSNFKDTIPIHYNEKIDKIEIIEGGYRLFTNDQMIETKTILICSGNGNFNPRRLEVADADKCSNILYKINNINQYKNKNIVVLGGGDSAIDLANMLVPYAANLTLIHRRDEFRAHEESVQLLKSSKANILTLHHVESLTISNGLCQSLIVKDNHQMLKQVDLDYCFVSYGLLTSGNLFSTIVDCDISGIKVKSDMSTSLPGIYGAGNCISYLGKCRTLAAGFGEVATAITSIHQYLYPSKNPTFFSSTNYKK